MFSIYIKQVIKICYKPFIYKIKNNWKLYWTIFKYLSSFISSALFFIFNLLNPKHLTISLSYVVSIASANISYIKLDEPEEAKMLAKIIAINGVSIEV